MYILSVETTAKTMSVAISNNEKLVALTIVNSPNTHSKTLLPTIKNLLESSNLTIPEIDLFACSNPGSFTGVRIGVSTIKGLAFPLNKPCVSVSALMALARNIRNFNGVICPVMDARRNQVYNALFSLKNGSLKRLADDRAVTVPELENELDAIDDNVMILGDGSYLLSHNEKYRFADELTTCQNAFSVCLCALQTYNSEAQTAFTLSQLNPAYLRPSSATPLQNSGEK